MKQFYTLIASHNLTHVNRSHGQKQNITTDSFFADFFCAGFSVLFFSGFSVLFFSCSPVTGVADFFSDNRLSGISPLPSCSAGAGDGDLLLEFAYI